LPSLDSFNDFICKSCVKNNKFLISYKNNEKSLFNFVSLSPAIKRESTALKRKQEVGNTNIPKKLKVEELSSEKFDTPVSTCLLEHAIPATTEEFNLFLNDGWKKELCKCVRCLNIYHDNNLQFLFDEDYELDDEDDESNFDDKQSVVSIEEKGINQLNKIDRQVALDGISAYNDLKSDLMEYLKSFSNKDGNGKVVTKDDIEIFFE
ncbi:hypothetical protein HK099_001982, partial [Clydaea vesicula]